MRKTAFLLVLVGCAQTAVLPPARFSNAPPVRVVNDRRDVAQQPESREYARFLYHFDGQFLRQITRRLELHRARRAIAINAYDEVPDSTWFTNRVGVSDISPDELASAPGGVGSPESFTPWTITSSKVGGATVGFIIKDSRGQKWLVKFDQRGWPEVETATHVIVGKLFWGFGLNVTEDYIAFVKPSDLVLAADATSKDAFGHKSPLDKVELAKRLATVEPEPDGSLRVLVSHWLPGKPLGGHTAEGVRSDDPNDRIPHELRRDLRGLYALFAWLDHNDVHGANMLDVWVTDERDPKKHYVKHYWLDFGLALGFAATKHEDLRFGFEFFVDFATIAKSLISLGGVERRWETRRATMPRGLGLYEVRNYDPEKWVSSTPAYVPIYVADRIDKFWASKIIMRFTREQIRAVVATGRLTDPMAAATLTEALIARQRATARYWFERVNPLDGFVIEGDVLCFKDLSIVYGFEPANTTDYTLRSYDRNERRLSDVTAAPTNAGLGCSAFPMSRARDGYTIVEVATRRPNFTGATYVHVARDPATGRARVIGIWRP